MGYVNESYESPEVDRLTTSVKSTTGEIISSRVFTPYSTIRKAQYGYRSGPLSEDERAFIVNLDKVGKWGNIMTQIDALERIQRATTPEPKVRNGAFDVNKRDYSVIEAPVATVNSVLRATSSVSWTNRNHGYAQISAFSRKLPSFPSDGDLANMAGAQMRSYAPLRPDFDLTRFIGELRDTPRLLNLFSNRGAASQYAGSAYVGYQFGVAPTISDIQRGAEAVIKADELVNQFIRDASEVVARRATKLLESDHWSSSGRTHAGLQQSRHGDVTVKRDLGSSSSYAGPSWVNNSTWRRELRVFSLFEYFVGDPYGFTNRMGSYTERARKLLGGGLTLHTVYELTPWSWFVDWFYDIGSLLSYQQQVADYSLVQRAGGWLVEDHINASVSYSPRYLPNGTYWDGKAILTYKERKQRRRPGSPYNMGFTWPTNVSQWAILGALGLAKAPGIPLTRS